MKAALRVVLVLGAGLAAWNGYMFWLMSQPPERFAQGMARIPQPAMILSPFPVLWNVARGGSLEPGRPAPGFDLESHDRTARVQLAAHQGVRPLVLVFGSYT
jgi:hypothetical protein